MSGQIVCADLWAEDPLPIPNTGPDHVVTAPRRPRHIAPVRADATGPARPVHIHPLTFALASLKDRRRGAA